LSLTGKIALVTGAGTGIGKGTAIELAKRGAKVAVSYNASDEGAKHTARRIAEVGGESLLVKANVASKQEIDSMAKAVADYFGGIDILVNNAALQLNYNMDHSDEDYDRMMNINLKGYWQCIQAVVPYMKVSMWGRIINIASVHSKRPTDFDTVYAMTKGAIKMLGRESAIELAQYGITVNTIEPGAVDVGKQGKQERTRSLRKKFPMGRVGLPADVGSLVCYLASEETEFLNGVAIRLDGASMLL
jgi:glucose 1-dehydrogenase